MIAEVDAQLNRKIGNFFLQHLENAQKRLWIMSPWLSSTYIEPILEKKRAGLDVRVITSNNYLPGHKEALRELIEKQERIIKPRNQTLIIVGELLFIIGVISSYYTKGMGLILSVIGVVLYFVGREKKEFYWISKLGEGNLKILNSGSNLVHAKIYIADDYVIIGSANFTYDGLVQHIEGMATIKNEEFALKMINMMSQIDKTLNLKEISYNEVDMITQIPEHGATSYRRKIPYRFNRYKRRF